jgi:starvation-inducible DNA-binding protein
MYRTRSDLPGNIRTVSNDLLQARLADAVDLGAQAKQAHWNVKGPQFISLHELFDTVAGRAREWTDLVAERLVALGGTAEGTVTVVAERSKLPPYPLDVSNGLDHVKALSESLASFGKLLRANIDEATEAGDQATADIFTEVSRDVDKNLWLVEAHGQAES